jgi:hypothetical protein
LLGTTPYLSAKPVKAYHRAGTPLEDAVCALQVVSVLGRDPQRYGWLLDLWAKDSPAGVRLGEALLRCGYPEQAQAGRPSAAEAFDELFYRLDRDTARS